MKRVLSVVALTAVAVAGAVVANGVVDRVVVPAGEVGFLSSSATFELFEQPAAPSEEEYAGRILTGDLFGLGEPSPRPPTSQRLVGLRLLGTVVADDIVYSSALIVEVGRQARGFGVGDAVGGGQVLEINPREVVLLHDGRRVKIGITDGESSVSSAAPEPGSPRLDREALQNLSLEDFAQMGRATPHRGPDGSVDGWRLSGIRRGGMADTVGIQNGDVVHSVNGQPLDIHTWQALQSEADFEIRLTRRGELKTVTYAFE